MPEILINDFGPGQISQPVDTDIPMGAAQLARNADLRDFGKLKKSKGLLEHLDSLPSGTIFSKPFEFEFTKPSKQQVTFVHVVNSGRNEIWWRPYWNPATSAWVDDWQELTEFEGPLTIDAGSNTTTIVDAALASSIDDYYNTWVALNVTRQAAAEVYDYDGGTTTITLRDAIASQTTGDTVYLYRFPLMMPLEGPYTADSGTDTTTIVDTELRAFNDDHYVGWTVVNTTRSASATVTAYNAKTKTLTMGTIASQTSTDSYYLYKTDHDVGADELNIVRFFPRENAVEISVGNDYGYPTQAPLWFGWIPKRVFFDQDEGETVTDTTVEQFWMCRNVLDRPDSTVVTISDQGSGALTDDTFYVRARYIYDGYQIGPASEYTSLDVNGNAIDIDIQLAMFLNNSSNKPSEFEAILNKRITALQIEVAEGATNHISGNYYLYAEIPLVNFNNIIIRFPYPLGFTIQLWTRTSDLYDSVTISLQDSIWTDGGKTEANGLILGKFLRWDINVGHKSTRVDCNYKFRATVGDVHHRGPIYTDIKRDAFISRSVSGEKKGGGQPSDDVMPLTYITTLEAHGVTQITGLAELGGYLLIFTPRKVFKYVGESIFDEAISETGCVAPESIVNYNGVVYFVGTDDLYAYDGRSVRRLMYGKILDVWDDIAVADRLTTRATLFRNKGVIYLWLSGNTRLIYDILQDTWTQATSSNEYEYTGVDGEIYGTGSSNVIEFEADNFTDNLALTWTSKNFDFVREVGGRQVRSRGRVKDIIVKHKGDQELQFDFYDRSKSTSIPRRTVKFGPQENSKPTLPKELEFEAEQVYFTITENDQGGSAPTHEIDWVKILWEPVGY